MKLHSFEVISLRHNNWARGAELVNTGLKKHNVLPERIVSIVPIKAVNEMAGNTEAYGVFYLAGKE